MLELAHPFILKLHNSYKDTRYVYFLLELALGGELFTFLRKAGRFNEKSAKFYAAPVILAFELMHSKSIVYRDLKPENLILDSDGYIKVCDFGLAKVVTDRTWTLCGTPDYLAPEIILSKGHDRAVDYWATGILIYEMCAGFVPYYSDDPMEVYQLILGGDLKFPSHFSRACMDLCSKLLHQNQAKRLGNMKNGVKDIIKHKWFSGFDWGGLLSKKLTPPIQPVIKAADDMSNFDEYPEDEVEVAECLEWDPEL
jgi:serine/threonine protein kinase